MKILGFIVGGIAVLFVLMLIIGSNVSPEKAAQYDKEARADAMCDQMMSDSALGNERRMTREMCNQLKAKIKAERK